MRWGWRPSANDWGSAELGVESRPDLRWHPEPTYEIDEIIVLRDTHPDWINEP